ncbi:hypothetical protein OIU76_011894 [Salix suchowensis]|nr:hypothetical protein OIU76_011894 [Salix suchowensis]KAJ6357117.1 hypothetical protein OIU78_005076 [Salix suchowensis]
MDDNPLRIVLRNSVYGLLDRRKRSPSAPLISNLIVRVLSIFCVNKGESITVLCRQAINIWPEKATVMTEVVAKAAMWAGLRDMKGGKEERSMMFKETVVLIGLVQF